MLMVYFVDINKDLLYWLKVNQSVQQVLNKWIKENFRKRIVSVKSTHTIDPAKLDDLLP